MTSCNGNIQGLTGEGVIGGSGLSWTPAMKQHTPLLHLSASDPLHLAGERVTGVNGDLTVLSKGDVPTLMLSLSVSSARSTYVRRSMTETPTHASALLQGTTPLSISSDLISPSLKKYRNILIFMCEINIKLNIYIYIYVYIYICVCVCVCLCVYL